MFALNDYQDVFAQILGRDKPRFVTGVAPPTDTQSLALTDGDQVAVLWGETSSGIAIRGTDSVRIVGTKGGSVDLVAPASTVAELDLKYL